MTSRDFAFWLQGYFEIVAPTGGAVPMTAEQAGMIRRHLALVFKHEIDPSFGDEQKQEVLNHLHNDNPVVRC